MSKNKSGVWCEIQALRGSVAPGKKKDDGTTGSDAVKVDLKIVKCDKDPSRVGQVFQEYLYLTEKSYEFTLEKLRILGWTCNDITELEGLGSTRAAGVINTETYKGVAREKMGIFALKEPAPELEGNAKADFAKRFKAAAAKVAKVQVTDFNRGLERAELPDEPEAREVEPDPFGNEGYDSPDDLPF